MPRDTTQQRNARQPGAREIDEAFAPSGGVPAPRQPDPSETMVSMDTTPAVPATLDDALIALQRDFPRILAAETGEVETKTGRTYSYKYAGLAEVSEIALPLLAGYGLRWTCKPTWVEGLGFCLTYKLRHFSGEMEEGVWPLRDPREERPQDTGSRITYARRYALLAATGLAPAKDDDDARAAQDAAVRRETWEQAQPRQPETAVPPESPRVDVPKVAEELSTAPLKGWPVMWQQIAKANAADASSAVQVNGAELTWRQLFGYRFAERIDGLDSKDAWLAFREEIKAVGKGDLAKAGQLLPWTWQGVNPGDRLRQRGEELKRQDAQLPAILEQAIATAEDFDQLNAVRTRIDQERAELGAKVAAGLSDFANERQAALERRLHAEPARTVVPEASSVATGRTETVELPDAGYPGDPWAEDGPARPATVEPRPDFLEEDPDTTRDGTDDFSKAFYALHRSIWRGVDHGFVRGEMDGARERGELPDDEYAQLELTLMNRPGDLSTIDGMLWRADQAADLADCDTLRNEIKEAEDRKLWTTPQARKLYVALSVRRNEIRRIAA